MATSTHSDPRPAPRRQLRQPLIAELIADELRSRILRGDAGYEEFLPKQESLLDEFNVSKPSIREALRILETEGLIRVRRGSQGGASIHRPESRDAAYMLGIVLQSKRVGLDDIGAALCRLEPTCAALCASMPDRSEIVAALESVHADSIAAIDDELEFVDRMRRFHEAIVDGCANETMQVLIGSLTAIWTAEEQKWARSSAGSTEYPDITLRREGILAHERLIELIRDGNSEQVTRTHFNHLSASQIYALSSATSGVVDATVLRHR